MGNAHSLQTSATSGSFTGVLPGSGDKKVTITRTPSTKPAILSNTGMPETPGESDGTIRAPVLVTNASTFPACIESVMRIQTPAHALLLQDSIQTTTRCSEGNSARVGDSVHREVGGALDSEFAIPESVRKSRILDEFAGVYSEILPQFLYVSNLESAKDPSKLQKLGITHIVNCCKELCTTESIAKIGCSMQSLELALHDDVHEDLSWFFYQVVAFIQRARDNHQDPPCKVLVHCHQGVSRSCAFAIAFVMYQQQQQGQLPSFRDAMAFVKSKRPIASPNTAFLCQLIEWERELSAFPSFSATPLALASHNTLYRLAPHAAHDPTTLVLKSCFIPEVIPQRQKVIIPLDRGDENDGETYEHIGAAVRHWLFTRGIFVFLRRATPLSINLCKVVIWQGSKCDIPDGVELAEKLVEQMASVRLNGAGSSAQVDIEIVEEDPEESAQIDHFGYARELDWIKRDNSPTMSSTPTSTNDGVYITDGGDVRGGSFQELVEAVATIEVAGHGDCQQSTRKPLLFVLEDISDYGDSAGSWDQLKVYDSEDLTPSDAFLLFQPPSAQHHFLWIGDACSFAREAIVRCAERYVLEMSTSADAQVTNSDGPSKVKVEECGDESDEFWAAFERGY